MYPALIFHFVVFYVYLVIKHFFFHTVGWWSTLSLTDRDSTLLWNIILFSSNISLASAPLIFMSTWTTHFPTLFEAKISATTINFASKPFVYQLHVFSLSYFGWMRTCVSVKSINMHVNTITSRELGVLGWRSCPLHSCIQFYGVLSKYPRQW